MSILKTVEAKLAAERSAKQDTGKNERLGSTPAKFLRAFVISRMPKTNGKPGEMMVTGSDVLADENNASLKLPDVPEDYIVVVGDMANPDSTRWYKKANAADREAAQAKRNDLIDSSRMMTMTDADREALFFNMIPRQQRGISEHFLMTSPDKFVSATRMAAFISTGGDRNTSLESILQNASIDVIELGFK